MARTRESVRQGLFASYFSDENREALLEQERLEEERRRQEEERARLEASARPDFSGVTTEVDGPVATPATDPSRLQEILGNLLTSEGLPGNPYTDAVLADRESILTAAGAISGAQDPYVRDALAGSLQSAAGRLTNAAMTAAEFTPANVLDVAGAVDFRDNPIRDWGNAQQEAGNLRNAEALAAAEAEGRDLGFYGTRTGADILQSPESFLSVLGPAGGGIALGSAFFSNYDEARQELPDNKALAYAMVSTAPELTELYGGARGREGADFLKGQLENVVGRIAKRGGAEAGQEMFVTLSEMGVDKFLATYSDDPEIKAYAEAKLPLDVMDAWDRVSRAGLAGGTAGTLMTAPGEVLADTQRAGKLVGDLLNQYPSRPASLEQSPTTAIQPTQTDLFGPVPAQPQIDAPLPPVEPTVDPAQTSLLPEVGPSLPTEAVQQQTAVREDVRKSIEARQKRIEKQAENARKKERKAFIDTQLDEVSTLPAEEQEAAVTRRALQWDMDNPVDRYMEQAQQPRTSRPPTPRAARSAPVPAAPVQAETAADQLDALAGEAGFSSVAQTSNAAPLNTGENAAPLNTGEVATAIAARMDRGDNRKAAAILTNANVELVDTAQQIPANAVSTSTGAFYSTENGMTYIVAENLDRDQPIVGQILSRAAHEAKHAGDLSGNTDLRAGALSTIIGPERNERLNAQIRQEAERNPNGVAARALQRAQDATREGSVRELEIPAYFIEEMRNARDRTGAAGKIARDIVSAARVGAKRILPGDYDVNLNDVSYLSEQLLTQTALTQQDTLPAQENLDAAGLRTRVRDGLNMIQGPLSERYAQAKQEGWTYRSMDGKEKFVTSDASSRLDRTGVRALLSAPEGEGITTDSILRHNELFADYPPLAGIGVYPVKNTNHEAAYYNGDQNDPPYIVVKEDNLRAALRSPRAMDELRGMILHELQHAVQDIEGSSLGGNTDMFMTPEDRKLRFEADAGLREFTDLKKRATELAWADDSDIPEANRQMIRDTLISYTDRNLTSQEVTDTLAEEVALLPEGSQGREVVGAVVEAFERLNPTNQQARRMQTRVLRDYMDLLGEREAVFTQLQRDLQQDQLPRNPEDPAAATGFSDGQAQQARDYDGRAIVRRSNDDIVADRFEAAQFEPEVEGLASIASPAGETIRDAQLRTVQAEQSFLSTMSALGPEARRLSNTIAEQTAETSGLTGVALANAQTEAYRNAAQDGRSPDTFLGTLRLRALEEAQRTRDADFDRNLQELVDNAVTAIENSGNDFLIRRTERAIAAAESDVDIAATLVQSADVLRSGGLASETDPAPRPIPASPHSTPRTTSTVAWTMAKRALVSDGGVPNSIAEVVRAAHNGQAARALRSNSLTHNYRKSLKNVIKNSGGELTYDQLSDTLMEEMDRIDALPTREARDEAVADLDKKYPVANPQKDLTIGKALRAIRDAKRNYTREIIALRKENPKPLTEKELSIFRKMVQNDERYTTRAYLSTYNAQVGKDYRETLMERARKDASSEEAARVREAIDFLVDNELVVPDLNTLIGMPMEQVRRMYEGWGLGPADNFKGQSGKAEMANRLQEFVGASRSEMEARAMGIVEDMLGFRGQDARQRRRVTRTTSADQTIVSARSDVPAPLRKLLGEITDPVLQQAITLHRMGNYVSKTKMMNELHARGENVSWADARSEVFRHRLAENPGYGPMSGKYVTDDLYYALTSVVKMDQELDVAFGEAMRDPAAVAQLGGELLTSSMRKIVGWQKATQVVISPANMMLNMMGSPLMAISNGLYSPLRWGRGAQDAATALAADVSLNMIEGDKALNLAIELAEAGALDTASVGMFQSDAFEALRKELRAQVRRGESPSMWKAGWEIIRSSTGKSADTVRNVYALMDVWTKVATYQDRKNFWTEFNRAEKRGMTPEDIRRKAGFDASTTNISYDRAIPLARAAEQNTPFAVFLTYFSEAMIRVPMMNMVQAYRDAKLAQSATTPEGRRLAAGQAASRAIGTSIATGGIITATLAALSAEDEDEKAQRALDPEWYQNSIMVPIGKDEEGHTRYYPLNRIDPLGPLNETVVALINADDKAQAVIDAATDYFVPSSAVGAAWQLVTDAAVGLAGIEGADKPTQGSWIKDAWPEGYNALTQLENDGDIPENFLAFVDKLTPVWPLKAWVQEERDALGFRPHVRDPQKSMTFRIMDYKNARNDMSRDLRKFLENDPSPEQIMTRMNGILTREQRELDKLSKAYSGYLASPRDPKDLTGPKLTPSHASKIFRDESLSSVLPLLSRGQFRSSVIDPKSIDRWYKNELKKKKTPEERKKLNETRRTVIMAYRDVMQERKND